MLFLFLWFDLGMSTSFYGCLSDVIIRLSLEWSNTGATWSELDQVKLVDKSTGPGKIYSETVGLEVGPWVLRWPWKEGRMGEGRSVATFKGSCFWTKQVKKATWADPGLCSWRWPHARGKQRQHRGNGKGRKPGKGDYKERGFASRGSGTSFKSCRWQWVRGTILSS